MRDEMHAMRPRPVATNVTSNMFHFCGNLSGVTKSF
jgi:hypothetical protein